MGMLKNPDGKKLNCQQKGERYKSLTKQSMKDECDINRIVARAMAQGGLVPPEAVYGDVSHISPESYLEMKNSVSEVVGEFEHLSSDQRRYYGSPEGYLNAQMKERLEYLANEKELAEQAAAKAALAESKEDEVPESKEIKPAE